MDHVFCVPLDELMREMEGSSEPYIFARISKDDLYWLRFGGYLAELQHDDVYRIDLHDMRDHAPTMCN